MSAAPVFPDRRPYGESDFLLLRDGDIYRLTSPVPDEKIPMLLEVGLESLDIRIRVFYRLQSIPPEHDARIIAEGIINDKIIPAIEQSLKNHMLLVDDGKLPRYFG